MEQVDAMLRRLIDQVRGDFDRLRWETHPIHAQLLHRATNAEAEGVEGTPMPQGKLVGFQGAGNRQSYQRFDENGNPLFRQDAILDVEGRPVVNSAGDAFDVVMPASRTVAFVGRHEDYSLLRNIAERAGRIAARISSLPVLQNLVGWNFSTPGDLWWALVFEIAWSQKHPLLVATRRIWLPAEKPNTFLPYNEDQLRRLAESPLEFKIPQTWLLRLPDAWVSELDNVAAASLDAVDFLLTELNSEQALVTPETHNITDATNRAEEPEMKVKIKRRFAVALSFPGEHRDLVKSVAEMLRAALGEDRVFYDKFHEVELARPNLDLILQRFYSQDSDVIVVFVSGKYSEKEWCGLEWRAIRELIKSKVRADEDLMVLRVDDAPLEGLLSIDGYIDISNRAPREIADLILRRWTAAR